MERKVTLSLLTCGAVKVLFSAIVSSTFTLFPIEGEALGFIPEERALILSVFPLAYMVALFPAGKLCDDAKTARGVLAIAVLGLGLSSILFGFSTRVSSFTAARSAQGLFSAGADVAAGALVAASAGDTLAWAEGMLESCEALGWILGPPVGAFLYASLGFVAAFGTWAALCIGLLVPAILQSCSSHKAPVGAYSALEACEEQCDTKKKEDNVVALLLRGTSIFAYGASSGAMYSGLALHFRALGVGMTAALQLLVAVSYLVAAPMVGQACDGCGVVGLWRRLSLGWAILAGGFALLAASLGGPATTAAALLLMGLGEAYVLIPSYPLLTLASPERPGLVAAVFNGAWAVGQGTGPFLLAVMSWRQAMALASATAVVAAPVVLSAGRRQT